MLTGTQRHWALSLRQDWAHLCKGIHASCRSRVCSGCSWPSPSLVGMLSNVGASIQGERTAHRHVVLHRDLGKKEKIEKSKNLMISIFCLWILNNSYTILFTASSLFSDFFPHSIWCGPESYSKPARYIQSSGAVSHPELSVWNKLEKLLPFLVQATSQWTDDLPYSSVFRRQQCKKWPLLCKLPESR